MYKLTPNPKYTYNASFIMKFEDDECTKYGRTVHDIVKTWWVIVQLAKLSNYTHWTF
jgi:hypothetical protein